MAGNKQSGRKSKAAEHTAMVLALTAIDAAYGSEYEFWLTIANGSKENDRHGQFCKQKLLDYAYGKPKETVEKTVIKKHVVDLPDK